MRWVADRSLPGRRVFLHDDPRFVITRWAMGDKERFRGHIVPLGLKHDKPKPVEEVIWTPSKIEAARIMEQRYEQERQ